MTTKQKPLIRALLGFLIDQRAVKFNAPISPAAGLARLERGTSTRSFAVWGQPGLVGQVSAQFVYLTRQSALTSGGFKPLFFGRIESTDPEHDEACELAGHFAMPWSAAFIFAVAFVICVIWALRTLATVVLHDASAEALVYSMGSVVAVAVLFWIARLGGRRDEKWLRERIEALLAEPVPKPDATLDA